jgi:hypothetical protein
MKLGNLLNVASLAWVAFLVMAVAHLLFEHAG